MKNSVFKKLIMVLALNIFLIGFSIISGLSMGCGSGNQTDTGGPTGSGGTTVLGSGGISSGTGGTSLESAGSSGGAEAGSGGSSLGSGGAGAVTTITQLASNQYHSCVLLNDGAIKCWGDNSFGVLGDGTTTERLTATPVSGISHAVSIATGAYHNCAVLNNGTVSCWGGNGSGQLGNGLRVDYQRIPVDVLDGSAPLVNVSFVTAGGDHSCARLTDGTAKCWGANSSGQLGNGVMGGFSLTPVNVLDESGHNLTGIISISAGKNYTCALLSGGSISCWGANSEGQLGNGTRDAAPNAHLVTGILGATAIATGDSHACALLSGGTVSCWGANSYGNLGDGTTTSSVVPTFVSGLNNVVSIIAGNSHSCARLTDGTAKCWGGNGYGQLGNGKTYPSLIPVNVLSGPGANLTDVRSISAGRAHTCALLSSGAVKCWGDNLDGQLGKGTVSYLTTPVNVVSGAGGSSLTGASFIATGFSHTCASIGSALQCWGNNDRGQLGNSGLSPSSIPVALPLSLPSGVSLSRIASGFEHSCVVLSDGTLRCWGANNSGQLGNGVYSSDPVSPTTVLSGGSAALSGVFSITAGGFHTCALMSDGTVKCWGANSGGELGGGAMTPSQAVPSSVAFPLGTVVSRVAAGRSHTCAMILDGTAQCWGGNYNGQIGNGIASSSPVASPTTVLLPGAPSLPLTGVSFLAAGEVHSCAVLSSGTVKCWGGNAYGQLGDGTYTNNPNPVSVSEITDATVIAAGYTHTCAIVGGGGVKCWGNNSYGQLGSSSIPSTSTPVSVLDTMGHALTGAINITANKNHTCVLISDGSVKCWGENNFGELGNGAVLNLIPLSNVLGL